MHVWVYIWTDGTKNGRMVRKMDQKIKDGWKDHNNGFVCMHLWKNGSKDTWIGGCTDGLIPENIDL